MRAHLLSVAGAALLAAMPADAQRDARCTTTRRPAQFSAAETAISERAALQGAVLDSIESDVEAAAREAGIQEPRGIVVLAIQDHATGQAEIHLHESNVRESFVRDALARRASLLATLPRAENTLYFRLEPVTLPEVDSVVVECLPRATNADRFARDVRHIVRRADGSSVGGIVLLHMLVTGEGEVAYVELLRRTGRPEVDRALVQAAGRLRFRPASVEGVPVDVWVEQPVSLAAQ